MHASASLEDRVEMNLLSQVSFIIKATKVITLLMMQLC